MGYIFISYAREDRSFVSRLSQRMREHDVPFWDDSHIDHGDAWYSTTERRLDDSAAMVLVMTLASRESAWVTNELLRAQRKGIPVRPLLVGGDPWLAVESVNFIDLREGGMPDDAFFDDLLSVTSSGDNRPTRASDDWQEARLFLPRQTSDGHDSPPTPQSGPVEDESRAPPGGMSLHIAESDGFSPPRARSDKPRARTRPNRRPRRSRRRVWATTGLLFLLGALLTWAVIDWGGFDEVLGFQEYGLGGLDGQDGWSSSGAVDVVVDPLDDSNQVLRLSSASAQAHRAMAAIGEGASGTLFFRIFRDGPVNASAGLSAAAEPAEFLHYEAQANMQESEDLNARSGERFVRVGEVDEGAWQCVWIVADNADETYKMYGLGGPYEELTRLRSEGKTVFDFRNGTTDALDRFFSRNGSRPVDGAVHLDDIAVDTSGENLTVPLGDTDQKCQ